MLKKLSNKGFTLVELLATIVILGILSGVTIVSVTSYYKKSQEKAETAFIKQLENYIEDYISQYGSKLKIDTINGENKNKCYIKIEENTQEEVCNTITLYPIINDPNITDINNNITNKDLINPATKEKCTDDNVKIEIFKDTDYVYCFTIEASNQPSCISDKIDTCAGLYK